MAKDTSKATDARKNKKEANIRMVQKLMIRGYKAVDDIKQALSRQNPPIELTDRTIYRYRGIIAMRNAKKIRNKEGLNKTVEEIAFEIKQTFEEVLTEAWRQYHSTAIQNHKCESCGKEQKVRIPTGPTYKIQALKEIRETTEKQLAILQDLGLISKEPTKTQIIGPDGKPVDSLVNVDKIELNQQFIAFIKAKYQQPTTAVIRSIVENTADKKVQENAR